MFNRFTLWLKTLIKASFYECFIELAFPDQKFDFREVNYDELLLKKKDIFLSVKTRK